MKLMCSQQELECFDYNYCKLNRLICEIWLYYNNINSNFSLQNYKLIHPISFIQNNFHLSNYYYWLTLISILIDPHSTRPCISLNRRVTPSSLVFFKNQFVPTTHLLGQKIKILISIPKCLPILGSSCCVFVGHIMCIHHESSDVVVSKNGKISTKIL